MDVHCSTCEEPWDVHHLWQEAIFDTALSIEECKLWRLLPRSQKLADRYRTEFKAAHWAFGQTVINVIRCPTCPKDATPNTDRMQTKAALETLFGNDEDGLAATFEDYRL